MECCRWPKIQDLFAGNYERINRDFEEETITSFSFEDFIWFMNLNIEDVSALSDDE